MQIELWVIGKTSQEYVKKGIDFFLKRISKFHSIRIEQLPDVKAIKDSKILKKKEAEAILKRLKNNDFLIILDEKGALKNSISFAKDMERLLSTINSRIVFLIGGAYGFDELIYQRANQKISLSEMTFSHQIVRLLFLEQLYRAFTIIHNHPYHNN